MPRMPIIVNITGPKKIKLINPFDISGSTSSQKIKTPCDRYVSSQKPCDKKLKNKNI